MAAPGQPFVGRIVLDVPAANPTLRFDDPLPTPTHLGTNVYLSAA